MAVKNQKLRDQFDADASTSSFGSGDGESHNSENGGDKGIFHRVSIFVDGYTVPSSQVWLIPLPNSDVWYIDWFI